MDSDWVRRKRVDARKNRIRPPGRDKRRGRIRDDYAYQSNYALLASYGITARQRDELAASQMGQCAMCGRTPQQLVVDHCHKTGGVRGLLCRQCNTALGVFRDDVEVGARLVEQAAKYLAREHLYPGRRK